MDMISVLKHLIEQEACFPALKLIWDDQVDASNWGELPKITPTHYLNENRLTTDERHKLLCRQQKKMQCRKPGAEVMIEPPIIVFQNYKFGEKYSFPIIVRNISKKSQKVALLMDESYVFKFDECSQRVAKFPCGMCISATITFSPESAMDDYYHKMIVSTNTTKVAVPIIGIGTRPLLNAPDSLILSNVPVRHWTVKPVTVLNVGKRTARFTLTTTGSFCVKPEKGVIPPSHSFTFDVAYYSEKLATHEGEICVKYENGEEIYIYLRANSVNFDIKLSSPDLRCVDTYMGLQTETTFFIENNSNITARFFWKKLEEAPEGSVTVHRPSVYANRDSIPEAPGDLLAVALEHALAKDNSRTAVSIEEDLLEVQEGPDHLFHNDNFNVYPLFGEIKPNSKIEIHLVFCPTNCYFYEDVAYLDINGLEKRIPFKFYGRGLGPKFKLGFEVLHVGDVTLGGAYTYEVPLQNVSEIPGTIQCDGLVGLPFGMEMKVEPAFLDVSPEQYTAFYVNFTCTGKPGQFEDEVKFSTPETGDAFYVTVKGTITYPSLRFTTTEAYLGNISYGFPKTFFLPLVNDSMNYVLVELKMDNDGTDPPVDFNTIMKSFKNEKFTFDLNPAEFKIYPTRFTIRPNGIQRVQLTMYPNQVRAVANKLKCWITDTDGNDVESVASINIRGNVVVPTLEPVKENVHIRDCYLQYPYQAEFIVKNPTELPVMYCVVPKPSTNLKIESKHFVGVANPWVETRIPFIVVCHNPGESVATFDLHSVGDSDNVQTLTLKAESIPSKVEASAKYVDFGKIEVLEDKLCTVDIINTSPINFPFTATVYQDEPSEKGDSWIVEPETGLLPSQTRVTLIVHLLLKEVGYHYAGVRVQMMEPIRHVIEVKMKALGVGSPLVFQPPIEKNAILDFGTIFIKQERYFEYEVTNHGVNARMMEWMPVGAKAPLNRQESKGGRNNPNVKKSVNAGDVEKVKKYKQGFVLSPMRVIIPAGGSVKFSISAYSFTPKVLEESLNLWSYVPASKGQQVEDNNANAKPDFRARAKTVYKISTKKKPKPPPGEPQDLHLRPTILNEVKLHASFEAPGLKFSKKSLHFIIEATPTHDDFVLEETIKIDNVGSLPLRVRLRTKFPFSFCLRNTDEPTEEATYPFETQTSMIFRVQFDGRHLRKELGVVSFDGKLEAVYEGLQATESIELHGEVRFPQLSIERNFIDFGTITNGMEAVEQITVTNPGTFCLTYKWYIKPGTTSVQKNPEPEWLQDLFFDSFKPAVTNRLMVLKQTSPQSKLLSNNNRDKGGSKYLFEVKSKDQFAQTLGINSSYRDGGSNYEDFTAFIKEKMYRSRMMEFIGLKDSELEAEDEVNYLAYYNQNALLPKEEFNTNELIDIIPLAGVIQAGQSQTFTVVFYGYPDITFNTSLVLYVEGGARKTVEVTGTTVPPSPITERLTQKLTNYNTESSTVAPTEEETSSSHLKT